jgi:cell wall-associated NlpC family hydrolase
MLDTEQITAEREHVVAESVSWVGTPFHHAAHIKGVGVDCANLLVEVYVGAGLITAPIVEPYPPDWFLHGTADLFRSWVAQYCVQVERPQLGDIVLYRYGRFASHGGVVVCIEPAEIIHAFAQAGSVQRQECIRGTPLYDRIDSYWTLERWT